MKVRFTVVVYTARDERVGVIGSLPELGDWKTAKPLAPLHVAADRFHGSCWTVTLNVRDDVFVSKRPFQYKFVKWHCRDSEPVSPNQGTCCVPDHLPVSQDTPRVDAPSAASTRVLPSIPPIFLSLLQYRPCDLSQVSWEGDGSKDNRLFVFSAQEAGLASEQENCVESRARLNANYSRIHLFDPVLNLLHDEYCLPVILFKEGPNSSGGYNNSNAEAVHTTRYYMRYKNMQLIHYNRITDRIVVGTCPRSTNDLLLLREKEKITDVINFQDSNDIKENFISPTEVPHREKRSAEYIMSACDRLNLNYIWLPTLDMCSDARARQVAQATFLLAGLLTRRGPEPCTGVYVHCNAGVGRSMACVAAFLTYCEGIPLRLTNLFLSSRRPVGFFDEVALTKGFADFKLKFGDGYKRLLAERGVAGSAGATATGNTIEERTAAQLPDNNNTS